MEDGKKYLTLPSNYVTLAQLQERWLNEQQRKQREKEEEDRKQRKKEEEKRKQREKGEEKRKNREKEEGKRKQGEKEEEKRKNREKEEGKGKREVQENRRQSKNGETNRTNSVSISSHRPFQRNFRNQSGKNHRTVEVSEPKVDESGSEAINYQEQNGDESKKKNKRNKWMEKRSRAQKDLTEGTALLPPENEPEEKVPVVVTEMNSEKEKTGSEILPHGKNLTENELEEQISVVMTEMNGEKKGVRSNFRPKGKSLAVYGKVWEQKGLLDGSAEIRPNFKNLSLNGGKESNQRSAEMNGGHWKYNRGSGRLDSRSTRKPIDANLAWVRKGEISDADAARTQI